MMAAAPGRWLRRAQPWLGTLVEVGVPAGASAAIDRAFAAVSEAQAALSRFEAASDVARFDALPAGGRIALRPATRQVLAAADELRTASDGAFDISLGTGVQGWALRGATLHKLAPGVRLDLGGIGKGHAVDLAVEALIDAGCGAGWVNAGGDLRVFGDLDTPLRLRDELHGGVRPFATLRDGAFATSHFGATSRSRLRVPAGAPLPSAGATHASVAAPRCLWADALTKLVALSGDTAHPLLARHEAHAWLH